MELTIKNDVTYITTSHSLDNVFDGCSRKFEFLTFYDKRPARDSGYAADVGTSLHEGLQEYLRCRAEGLSDDVALTRAYMALMMWFPWAEENEQTTGTRSFQNTNLMLYKLIRHPMWDDWELVEVTGRGWATEIAFRIRHDSLGTFVDKNTGRKCRFATQGKIDMVMRHRVSGVIATIDLKTTVYDESLTEASYKFSGQQVGYSQVVQALLGEMQAKFTVYYLVARFSATYEPQIQVVDFEKDQDDIDDYWLTKVDRLRRIQAYSESGWFPRTSGGCHSWGQPCFFLDICAHRNYRFISRWFDTIDTEDQRGYDYWVDLAA